MKNRSILSVIKKAIKLILSRLQKITFDRKSIYVIASDITTEQLDDLRSRIAFFLPGKMLSIQANLPVRIAIAGQPLLLFDNTTKIPKMLKSLTKAIDIDYRHNPTDGWAWLDAANYYAKEEVDIPTSKKHFRFYVEKMKSLDLSRSYIFGTGPSLDKALSRDWSDGYRIVCNTIVRDPELWKHINPHFIVAGDAIYHFGHTQFARAFRNDLVSRIQETGTYFVYPSIFDVIVRRELNEIKQFLIPVPTGENPSSCKDLAADFKLPGLGNVLPLLLLPLACTLSKNIFLWGFDGRAPDDKLFWSNSTKHSYPELMPGLLEAHPAFFNHFVPKENPNQYVQAVHGDVLDEQMSIAENRGWTFTMMHKSWTPTLQKRFSDQV